MAIPVAGFVDITYDDTLAVGDDFNNCDLISVRVVIEPGQTATYEIQRGQSQNWNSGSATGPIDETFTAGGPVKKVGDLSMFTFGGGG